MQKGSKIIKILLTLLVFGLITSLPIAFAKMFSTKNFFDKASVANFIVKTTQVTDNTDLIITTSETNNLYSFLVSNYDDKQICNVTTSYDVIITCPISSPLLQQIKITLICDGQEINCSNINNTGKQTIYTFNNVGLLYASKKTAQRCNIYITSTTDEIYYLHCKDIVVEVLAEQVNKEI